MRRTASEPSPSLPGFGNGSPAGPGCRAVGGQKTASDVSPLFFVVMGRGGDPPRQMMMGPSSGSVQAWVRHRSLRPVFHGVLFACSRESRPGAWSGCESEGMDRCTSHFNTANAHDDREGLLHPVELWEC